MITIIPYNPEWPIRFQEFAKPIMEALKDDALAIHHIGSTSVPGLGAKDIIDMQLTVASLDKQLIPIIEGLGYEYRDYSDHRPPGRDDIPDAELAKLYFRKRTAPAANLHVRVARHFNQQYPILCRDYLRAHPFAAKAYEEVKQQLAKHFPNDINAYYDVKDPVFDILMEGAYEWAEKTGWQAGEE